MPCLHEHMYSAHHRCCVATLHIMHTPKTSLPSRHSQCESLWTHKTKKDEQHSLFVLKNLVRTKGLEPPRLSASDPKSDVATNYTMSAWILANRNPQPGCFSGAKIKLFYNIRNFPSLNFLIFYSFADVACMNCRLSIE